MTADGIDQGSAFSLFRDFAKVCLLPKTTGVWDEGRKGRGKVREDEGNGSAGVHSYDMARQTSFREAPVKPFQNNTEKPDKNSL